MKRWSFDKYVACGNDFILFDNRKGLFPIKAPLIRSLCDRHRGIGADGLLLLESPGDEAAHFRFRIFNSDGSEAEMCGNGLRCFVKWLFQLGMRYPLYKIQTMQALLTAQVVGKKICIEVPEPTCCEWNISLTLPSEETLLRRPHSSLLHLQRLSVGVPHAVIFCEEIASIDLASLGPYIRHHPRFAPKGVNVSLVEKKRDQRLKIRTFERGVEQETLGCGTGAVAAALSLAHLYGASSPIYVETSCHDEMKIDFQHHAPLFSHIRLTGGAERVYRGEIEF